MTAVCIAASNMILSGQDSTSLRICHRVACMLAGQEIESEIIDLREMGLSPCVGCGGCFDSRRCCRDTAFNEIYDRLAKADGLFIISPHYAPIPAKLCMLLEKMEEITFLHWWKDQSYRSELHGLPVGIISHGGAGQWALPSYRAMVNDTIANALDTIQCAVVAGGEAWPTGISLPVREVAETDGVFPVQEYDWTAIDRQLADYVRSVARRMAWAAPSTGGEWRKPCNPASTQEM